MTFPRFPYENGLQRVVTLMSRSGLHFTRAAEFARRIHSPKVSGARHLKGRFSGLSIFHAATLIRLCRAHTPGVKMMSSEGISMGVIAYMAVNMDQPALPVITHRMSTPEKSLTSNPSTATWHANATGTYSASRDHGSTERKACCAASAGLNAFATQMVATIKQTRETTVPSLSTALRPAKAFNMAAHLRPPSPSTMVPPDRVCAAGNYLPSAPARSGPRSGNASPGAHHQSWPNSCTLRARMFAK